MYDVGCPLKFHIDTKKIDLKNTHTHNNVTILEIIKINCGKPIILSNPFVKQISIL